MSLRAGLQGRDTLWLGWSGSISDRMDLQHHAGDEQSLATFDLPAHDHALYYNGFANRALWPLLHFRTDLMRFTEEEAEAYYRVNELFARHVLSVLRPTDTLWVHDFHLIPLAQALRARGVANRIGFFFHVPVPPADLLATLPGCARLISALAHYDHIGVQSGADFRRLSDAFSLFEVLVVAGGQGDRTDGHVPTLGVHPIGIDVAGIAEKAGRSVGRPAVRKLMSSLNGRSLAVGVDRLDYSKGLTQRFNGFARYLDMTADTSDRVTYLQISPTTRTSVAEYRMLKASLERSAGRLNGHHAQVDWTPLRYVNRNFDRGTLMGILRTARLGLVTPLRDGMNLVAQEYVAAQNRDDPGVLILSRFAGAAELLQSALLVNPHNEVEIANAIEQGVAMAKSERIERFHEAFATLGKNSLAAWSDRFLGALEG